MLWDNFHEMMPSHVAYYFVIIYVVLGGVSVNGETTNGSASFIRDLASPATTDASHVRVRFIHHAPDWWQPVSTMTTIALATYSYKRHWARPMDMIGKATG